MCVCVCVLLCMHAYICICTICKHTFPKHTLLSFNNVSHIRADHLVLYSQLVYVSMERKHFSHSQHVLVAFKFFWAFRFFFCMSVDVAQLIFRWCDFTCVASHIPRRYNHSKLPNLCGSCWSVPPSRFLGPVSSATETYLPHLLGNQRLILIFVVCLNIFWICGELKMSEKKTSLSHYVNCCSTSRIKKK